MATNGVCAQCSPYEIEKTAQMKKASANYRLRFTPPRTPHPHFTFALFPPLFIKFARNTPTTI